MAEPKEPKFTIKISTVATTVSGIVAILGSIWALDTHYASAQDIVDIKQNISETKQDFSKQILQMRREKYEDELFALDIKKARQKGKLSPDDAAVYERDNRRLQAIDDQLPKSKGQ
jgi:hypothetical protein